MKTFTQNYPVEDIIIVSGEAEGADKLGERWAEQHGCIVERFPADWGALDRTPCFIKFRADGTPYNALAGHLRNCQMALVADYVLVFHNGTSTGALNMIKTCENLKKKFYVFDFNGHLIKKYDSEG